MAKKTFQINLELSERNKHEDAIIITFPRALNIPLHIGQILRCEAIQDIGILSKKTCSESKTNMNKHKHMLLINVICVHEVSPLIMEKMFIWAHVEKRFLNPLSTQSLPAQEMQDHVGVNVNTTAENLPTTHSSRRI